MRPVFSSRGMSTENAAWVQLNWVFLPRVDESKIRKYGLNLKHAWIRVQEQVERRKNWEGVFALIWRT